MVNKVALFTCAAVLILVAVQSHSQDKHWTAAFKFGWNFFNDKPLGDLVGSTWSVAAEGVYWPGKSNFGIGGIYEFLYKTEPTSFEYGEVETDLTQKKIHLNVFYIFDFIHHEDFALYGNAGISFVHTDLRIDVVYNKDYLESHTIALPDNTLPDNTLPDTYVYHQGWKVGFNACVGLQYSIAFGEFRWVYVKDDLLAHELFGTGRGTRLGGIQLWGGVRF